MSLSHGDTVQEDELNRHASLSQEISLQAQSTETYQSIFNINTTDNHKASPNHDHGSFGAPLCSSEEIQKSFMKSSEHNSILDTSKAANVKNTAAASPLSYLRQSPLKVASDSFKGLFHRPDIDKPEKSNSRSAPNSPTKDAPTKLPSLSSIHEKLDVPDFSLLSKTGVELEAKQMNARLPDEFIVDSCKLSEEFVSASIIPGRRGKEIGKGATATVKIMYRKGSGKVPYAVKEFRRHSQDETAEEYEKNVKSEFSIANSLNHPNIVQTVRLCTQSGRWNHVMEYCNQGELFSLVQKQYLRSKDILCLFRQLLQGVSYLHSNGIAHRDIKLENLLLTEAGHLKIIDFGVSEVFSGLHPGLSSSNGECGMDLGEVRKCAPGICGSLPYIAPEVMAKNGDYDPRPLDVWSCAIVCVAMLLCSTPWQTAEQKNPHFSRFTEGWNSFMKEKPDGLIPDGPVNPSDLPPCGKIFSDISNKILRRLILRMLHPDPEKRFTISDVMNDPWVKRIECCCPEPYSPSTCYEQIGDRQVPKVHSHLPPVKKGVFNRYY